MSDTAFEKAWRTSPWFGNAHEGTVAWSFWQAASLNQAVQAEAHLHEPQTAETCQHKPPHPIGCLVLKEPDGPVGSIHVFAEDEEFICLACEAEKQARDAARLAFETLAEERDHLKAERDTASGRGNNFRERYWLLEQTHEQDVRRLVAERDAQTSALRNSVEQAAIELIAVKVERERHIEAAAHKELDWFAEKRRADLLEAKCAEMASVLRRTRHRLLVMVEADGEDALYADEIKAVDATLKDNPGQLLLDRLRRAEETCAAVYQWAGANEFPVELLDNLSIVAEGSEAEESPDCPYHKELPVAVDLKADLLERLKGTEECRDHYMNLLAEEVNLSNSLQERLEKLELIYHEAHFVKEPHLSLLMALKAGSKCTICSNEALAACEPKERE